MITIIRRAAVLLAGTAAALTLTAGTAGASAPRTPVNTSAVTQISNRPDSGNHDSATPGVNQTWANDTFTRTAAVHLVGEVAASFCPGTDTGHCYLFNGSLTDSGTFTTNPSSTSGSGSPRAGLSIDTAVTGTFAGGGTQFQFYSSWKTAAASRMPLAENDHGSLPAGKHTTGKWFAQFFGASEVYVLITGGANEGWTYTAGFGSDPACANDAYRWVDAAVSAWGTLSTDGDILAPDAAHCT